MFLWLVLFSYLPVFITATTPTMYLFAYSWTPGFCNGQNYPGCITPQNYWKQNFTIHGLWPQYTTSGYPSFCSNEPFNSSIPIEIGLDSLVERWPDVQYDINSPNYDSFWEHEWTKHGTCSGLTQYDYFNIALTLTNTIVTPEFIHDSIGYNVNADDIRYSINDPSTVSLQCHNQMLVGVYTCWQQENNIPTKITTCPQDVIQEDTCSNTSVYIPGL